MHSYNSQSLPAVIAATAIAVLLLHPTAPACAEESLLQKEQHRIAVLNRIAPSVVCVMDPGGAGGGSGVLISSDGFAISNYHVTAGAGSFLKCGLNDGRVYDAVIVGIDPTGDVSLIQLLGRDDFPAAEPGNSDSVQVGDEALALGNPFLLATDFTPTVTYGIVSGVHRYQYPSGTFLEYTDCIQIDASINPGNSGGPLFDRSGFWIGINGRASFEKRGRVNSGAAYAISVNQVLLFVEHLKSGLIIDHGRSGFAAATTENGDVIVTQVSELSEAWRRGLRSGAVLTSFAGRPLSSSNQLQNIIGIYPEGTRLPMQWTDADGAHSATIRLMPIHDFEAAPELPMERRQRRGPMPEEPEAEEPAGREELPRSLTERFEERRGYCNFYFNRRQKNQILDRLPAAPGLPEAETWSIEFTPRNAPAGPPGVLAVTPKTTGYRLGDQAWLQSRSEPDPNEEPAGFPGILAAVGELLSLLTMKDAGFDELTAFGSTVHIPLQQNLSVLISRSGLRQGRWYFSPDQHWPVALDLQYGVAIDEARVVFNEWSTEDGVSFPAEIGIIDPISETPVWFQVGRPSRRGASR